MEKVVLGVIISIAIIGFASMIIFTVIFCVRNISEHKEYRKKAKEEKRKQEAKRELEKIDETMRLVNKMREQGKMSQELKDCTSVSRCEDGLEKYNILTISKRSYLFGETHSFTTVPITITPTAYNPARYMYSSATVGGITTGGVSKIGGNYIRGKSEDSGKRRLKYCGTEIKRIQLTDELYEEAKKSETKEPCKCQ